MRVITGTAKGRRLKAPKGLETRPTSDRIKEALFNIIGTKVINVNFLDLFAGTGAIGIEALSRGADKAVFVEKNPKAVKIIRENLEITGLSERALVMVQEADKAVDTLSVKGERFGMIFIDPPYLKGFEKESLKRIDSKNLLNPGGLIITESSKLDNMPEEVGRIKLFRQERYGDTVLSFYQSTEN